MSNKWQPYSNPADIPIGELCLFVVSNWSNQKEVASGIMHRDGNGNPIGNIGGRFHFDWTGIHQWISVQNIVDLAELEAKNPDEPLKSDDG